MGTAACQALEVLMTFWVDLLVPPSGVLKEAPCFCEALIVCKFLNITLYQEDDMVVAMKSSNVSLICILLSYFHSCLSLLVTYLICFCCVVHLIKWIQSTHLWCSTVYNSEGYDLPAVQCSSVTLSFSQIVEPLEWKSLLDHWKLAAWIEQACSITVYNVTADAEVLYYTCIPGTCVQIHAEHWFHPVSLYWALGPLKEKTAVGWVW
jgi:hypothetical protein